MYVIGWTIIESLSDSPSNFFEVPGSIQKVVRFKGRINVQLPLAAAAPTLGSFGRLHQKPLREQF